MKNLSIQLIPIDGYRRKGIPMKPEYLTIHSIANIKSTAQNERNWLVNKSNKVQASFHYVVGEDIIIQCIPEKEVAFHAGCKNGNYHSIGIEMVETGDREKVYQNTIKLVVELMNKYDISLEKVYRHYDWTKKNCPRILNNDGKWSDWHVFKSRIAIIHKQEQIKQKVKEEINKVEIKIEPNPLEQIYKQIDEEKELEKIQTVLPESWKLKEVEDLIDKKILSDKVWLNRVEESVPLWVIATMLNRVMNKYDK